MPEKLIRKMQKVSTEAWKMKLNGRVETVWNQAIEMINHAPTVDIRENTRGEWQDLGGIIRWGCPKCHHAFYEKTNFCPYCGDDKRN